MSILFLALFYNIALLFPTITTLVSNTATDEKQGEALGVLVSVFAFGLAISPLFSGALVGRYPMMPIIIGSFCMLLAAMFFAPKTFQRKKL